MLENKQSALVFIMKQKQIGFMNNVPNDEGNVR